MPGTSAAKAKVKIRVAADAVVTVTNALPDPSIVQVNPQGTVQFVNKDEVDYRLRLWTREAERHADVDLLLPARGGITVIVDPEIKDKGECEYELFPTNLVNSTVAKTAAPTAKHAAKGGGSAKAASAKSGSGGGTIKIGSVPY
jgi:hypothetical protein